MKNLYLDNSNPRFQRNRIVMQASAGDSAESGEAPATGRVEDYLGGLGQ